MGFDRLDHFLQCKWQIQLCTKFLCQKIKTKSHEFDACISLAVSGRSWPHFTVPAKKSFDRFLTFVRSVHLMDQ